MLLKTTNFGFTYLIKESISITIFKVTAGNFKPYQMVAWWSDQRLFAVIVNLNQISWAKIGHCYQKFIRFSWVLRIPQNKDILPNCHYHWKYTHSS
jgi:hypothetical protein